MSGSTAVEWTAALADSFAGPAYCRSLERAIEESYRRRVGSDGTAIRIGPKGASPLILGVLLESRATGVFSIDAPESLR